LEVSPISISVKCGFIDSVPAAIAFYSENTIDKKYYIKESSVQAEQTSSSDFVAKIPSNAKLVVVSNIAKQLATPTITFIGTSTHTELERVKQELEATPFILQELPKSWVKVEDGTLVASGAHWHSTKYSVKGITRISVVGSYYDSLAAAVAFYSKDGTYLSEYTVPGKAGDNVRFETEVPLEAFYAIACSTKSTLPIVKTEEIGNIVDQLNETTTEASLAVRKVSDLYLGQSVYPFTPCMDYHHLFMDKIYLNTTATIPSQSIFDVFVAAKLGFKMIEVNVLLTSDGVAVTGHQAKQGGYLQTLSTLDGTPTEVHIPSITFEELRTNYRYKSVFAQYRTPITSLEEFLLEILHQFL
jgi:hypothetical protein